MTAPSPPEPAESSELAAVDPAASHVAPPRLVGAVFLASFGAIYLQVSLMKLMSVTFGAIFVYVLIGVALLGYGAAGSILAVRGAPAPGAAPRAMARGLIAMALVAFPAAITVNAIDLPAAQIFGFPQGLPMLLVTGETLPPDLARMVLRRYPKVRLVNAYGPGVAET